MYHRTHDGDTAKTSQVVNGDEASISSHESDAVGGDITISDIPTITRVLQGDGDASTAKSSTHYRLQRDKSRALAAQSQDESRRLLEMLQQEREALQAREELEKLRVSGTGPHQISPSAPRGTSGTAADSAGFQK